jgi:hypothetical protein
MNAIRDDELLVFVIGEGLEPVRIEEIRAALAGSPDLAQRLAAVSAGLDEALSAPVPHEDFEVRLWDRLEQRLPPRDVQPVLLATRRAPRVRFVAATLAMAATLVAAIGLGFHLGRQQPQAETAVAAFGNDAAQRVLAAYVSEHLDATERALMVAANSPGEEDTARALAGALVESNRLYAAAAERAGKAQLAAFLRQLEPVLIELARSDDATAVGERIRDEDLAFKTRAAAALTRRDLAPGLQRL